MPSSLGQTSKQIYTQWMVNAASPFQLDSFFTRPKAKRNILFLWLHSNVSHSAQRINLYGHHRFRFDHGIRGTCPKRNKYVCHFTWNWSNKKEGKKTHTQHPLITWWSVRFICCTFIFASLNFSPLVYFLITHTPLNMSITFFCSFVRLKRVFRFFFSFLPFSVGFISIVFCVFFFNQTFWIEAVNNTQTSTIYTTNTHAPTQYTLFLYIFFLSIWKKVNFSYIYTY